MFKLIANEQVEGIELFAIQDTSDGAVDIVEEYQVMNFLKLGIDIGGITYRPDINDFEYTDEFYDKAQPSDSDTGSYEIDDDSEDDYADYSEGYDCSEEDSDEENSDDDDDYVDPYAAEEDESSENDAKSSDDYVDYTDGYDDDEDDDDYSVYEAEETPVSKLYSYLTPEQIRVLKMYYLWFSQNIFNTAQKDPTLNIKDARRRALKKADLAQLRDEGGLWHYAGFIDTGYDGGGHCTLGHPLRYMHLAWDVTVSTIEDSFWGENYDLNLENIIASNNVIVFGIKCITDFFEVDSDCMKNLLKAQRESLKDMSILANIYENDEKDDAVSSFALLDEVMPAILRHDAKEKLVNGKNAKFLLTEGLSQFYIKFKQAGMIYPKSLVQCIRDEMVGWVGHKFIGENQTVTSSVEKILSVVTHKKSNVVFKKYASSFSFNNAKYCVGKRDLESALRCLIEKMFYVEMTGYYQYNPVEGKYKEEGGASEKMRNWYYSLCRSVRVFCHSDKLSLSDLYFAMDLVIVEKEISDLLDTGNLSVLDSEYVDGRYKIGTEKISKYRLRDLMRAYDSKKVNAAHSLLDIFSDYNSDRHMSYYNSKDLQKSYEENIELKDYLSKELPLFVEFEKSEIERDINEKNAEIDKREAEKRERREREERLKRAAEEKLASAEAEKAMTEEEHKLDDKTNKDRQFVLNYCIKALDDDDSIRKIEEKNPFIVKILSTIKRTGNASDKQMYYVSQGYEVLTGKKVSFSNNEKVLISENQNIALDIAKIQNKAEELHNVQGDKDADKTLAILDSILKYGTASTRQLKYVTKAKEDLNIQ